MATSGSYDYSITANDIITAALEDIEVVQNGETIDSDDYASALRTLNFMVKQWMGTADFSQGLKTFSRKRVCMFLEKGQQQYQIGPASADAKAAIVYGVTTLDAAEASGQTILSVAATSDTTTKPGTTTTMTAADIIGIQLTSGAIHWTTVASIAAGDTVTVDVALTGAAASGNIVYWYTNKAQRLLEVESAVLRDVNNYDTPMHIYRDVQSYDFLGYKRNATDPSSLIVEPQLITCQITFDVQPNDVQNRVILTGYYPSEDYDSSTGADTIAYPAQWYGALEWGLAKRLAPKFEQSWTKNRQDNYEEALAIAQSVNPKMTDASFEVNAPL